MADFMWDVWLPGEDLPHRLTTGYLISEGEEIAVNGREWLVERVEIDETIQDAIGLVWVAVPTEPEPAPESVP